MPKDGAMDQSGESDADATVRLYAQGQSVLGRFVLRKKLGQGGMGVVWLAFDERLQREVALKFLPEVVRLDAAALDDLRREARKCLELTHPGIVRIYDLIDDDDAAAISMEYVDGPTLSRLRLQREKFVFEPSELAGWAGQLCAALEYAHNEAQIVHRDLKPSNLLVNSKGRLKVADFGIARSISDSASRMSANQTSGTLAYMSPQQLEGERPSVLDDVYSLGATLFELIAGKPPFHSGDISRQISHKPAPSMTEKRAELGVVAEPIPAVWEQTVAACLSKDPRKRPASVVEVANRLGIEMGTRASSIQLDVSETIALQHQSHSSSRNWMAAGAIVGIVLLIGLGWLSVSRHLVTKDAGRGGLVAGEGKAKPSERRQALLLSAAFTNSLGMRFVPVGKVQFSVWETRVGDFRAFVQATGYKIPKDMIWYSAQGWQRGGHFWDDPPFQQDDQHPVCGMNYYDAVAFCEWLTKKEQAEGRIKPAQEYRLPTEAEWETAGGTNTYVWGNDWPPPKGAGNFAGEEVLKDGQWEAQGEVITGYSDLYPRTAPVGSFRPSNSGLFDLSGNVWEWCQDWADDTHREKVLRGGSWHNYNRMDFEVKFRSHNFLGDRNDSDGFRCVLAEVNEPTATASPLTNSLGMIFVKIPDTQLRFSIWETRVQDFEVFINDTGYDATQGVRSFNKTTQWSDVGDNWMKPGFAQTAQHPVVGVSWNDATTFCKWLTETERKQGRLTGQQRYRLPSQAEWGLAAGPDTYPWGENWPPLAGAGNYAGLEVVADGNWPEKRDVIAGYNDNYPRTAPVGSFQPNRYGIYDLGGNAREWCFDDAAANPGQKVSMGGAWDSNRAEVCRSQAVELLPVQARNTTTGFRCVLEGSTVPGKQ